MSALIRILVLVLVLSAPAAASDDAFSGYEAGFKNFITCELTRTDAVDHFKGKPFKITMINLHNLQPESDMTILTGAVQSFVQDRYITLYAAVGLETIAGKEKVSYYVIRPKSFSILATELLKYPYKERCPWARYWIDLD